VAHLGPAEDLVKAGVAKLAQYFPQAIRMRMPILVHTFGMPRTDEAPQQRISLITAAEFGQAVEKVEETVIEFGTHREVLFTSSLQLEFEDRIRLKNAEGTLDEEATIVAVQLSGERTVVAARFVEPPVNWVIRPAE
jgi:hypothetical protein